MLLSKINKNIDFSVENPCNVGCVYGKRDQKNMVNLHAIVSPGEYKISIFYAGSKNDKELFDSVGKEVKVGLFASFVPLVEKEDRINCKAGVLPSDLDGDGISYQGFIKFSDYLVADFSANVQQTRFYVSQESVLRIVTVQSDGSSVKVQLKNLNHKLLKESVLNHDTNSLVDVIDPGYYYIILSEAGTISEDTNNKFCETFHIQIGLNPRSSMKSLSSSFQDCSSEDSLSSLLSSIQSSLDKQGRFDLSPSSTFSLEPPKDDHEIVFHSDIELSTNVYSYFEIFSDFVSHDLVVLLTNKNEEVFHNVNHQYLQGSLKPGKYQFFISLRSPILGLKSTDCINFNLNIKLVATTKKSLDSWKCSNHFVYTLPNTLNTLDKLGPKGTDQHLLPPATLFGKQFLAPNSDIDAFDYTKFEVNTESFIKVLTEAAEGKMKLVIKSSDGKMNSVVDSSQEFPPTYALSANLVPGLEYELQVYYYPSDEKKCHVYELSLEVYPVVSGECKAREPDDSVIVHRSVDQNYFQFADNQGFAPVDPRFIYIRSKKQYKKSIPLEITDEFVLISGHLITNNFGLTIEIYKEGNLAEWGEFAATHRYQLAPLKLYQGSYTILLKDLFTSPTPECVHLSLSILIESFSFTKKAQNLMRKTETCLFNSPPPSLNFAGLLETGQVHIHQKIDADFNSHFINFELKEKALIRVFVQPKDFRNIQIKIKENLQVDDLVNAKVKELTDGLHTYLDKGKYYLIIVNDKSGFVRDECESLEFDLEVANESIVKKMEKMYDCRTSTDLEELSELGDICLVFDSSKNKNIVPVVVPEDSEVSIMMSYSNLLSGYLSLKLSNEQNDKISESIGQENLAQLKAFLPSGTYNLEIVSSTDPKISHPCWPLQISISLSNTQSTCIYGPVPSRLISKYGGPQSSDGSITFTGTFRISSSPDIIFIENPKNSIARITAISSNAKVFIEIVVFSDPRLQKKVGFSQGSLNRLSLILPLDATDTGYYLMISYITQLEEECLTFDLKLQIESLSTVKKLLQCSTVADKNLLPKQSFEFNKASDYSQDNLMVLGAWIRGTENMPKGSETENLLFSYTMSINIKQTGILSAQVLHDFLTSLFTLKLYSGENILASSKWEVIYYQQTHDRFNFAAILSGAVLEPGEYKLVLKTGVSSKMLLMKFPDAGLCFPFDFNIQFVPYDSKVNQLILVTPDELKSHNTIDPLSIRLTFRDPVDKLLVYLTTKSGEKVYPDKARVLDQGNMLVVDYLSGRLNPNECYKLGLHEVDLETYSVIHEYCMIGCKCNPKALATCSTDLECICPEPYTGKTCYKCVTGYTLNLGTCTEDSNEIKNYLVFGAIYTFLGVTLLYFIQYLRKRARNENAGFELADRQRQSTEINLFTD